MGVQYESQSDGTVATASGATITKPTGLAVGDIMVVVFSFIHTSAAIWSATGWSNLDGVVTTFSSARNSGSEACVAVGYKVATQTDVDATNFTFGSGGNSILRAGTIFRISGQDDEDPTGDWLGATSSGGTPSFATGVTPANESLLIFAITHAQSASSGVISVGSYAIASSNPSWTERRDEELSSQRSVMAIATANRPETTITGAWSCAVANTAGTTGSASILVSITVDTNVTVTPAVIVANASVVDPAISGGATITPAVIVANADVVDPTPTGQDKTVTNTSKSSTSWVNTDKS